MGYTHTRKPPKSGPPTEFLTPAELIPHVVPGDVMTADSFNHVIDVINGQLSLVPWVCPYCETMNKGTALECKSCRASRMEVT